jgi:O-antigen ligase
MNHIYLTRLVQFVRMDRVSDSYEARLEIYRRVPAMIAAHPLLGFGPGSSRVASAAYVSAGDRWGADFTHNTFLQVAVEQGLPAGAIYGALLLVPLAVAGRRWKAVRLDPLARGASFALVAFLVTQLTSNSLNVYLDQQFFFWLLTAILLGRLGIGPAESSDTGELLGTPCAQQH